jgi:KaiC/GvpD/RAD55 family RecA-like ATPase
MNAIETALQLLDMGMRPVKVLPASKKAYEDGWQKIIHDAESVRREFRPSDNVGALMGEPSGWIVDVDLDTPDAVKLASEYLPPTRMFGRAGKPRSHYLYRCVGALTRKWKDADGRMIVELRSTGCQTVMPGSTHESGEPIEWVDADAPIVDIEAHELTYAIDMLAKRCGWAPKDRAPRPAPAIVETRGPGYGNAALTAELDKLRRTAEGGRNDQLNDTAFRIAQLADAGELERGALDEVRAVALSIGLDAHEVDGTMRSAEAAAARNPRAPRERRAGIGPPIKREAEAPITREEATAMGGGYVDEFLADIRTTQGRKVGGIPIPGFPLLTDALFGLRGVCLLTAPSGMGKTTFVNTVALNVARGHGMLGNDAHEPVRVVYVTAEMSRADVTLSMASTLAALKQRIWVTGEANGEEAPDGLVLQWATRERAARALSTLRTLESGKLLMLDAHKFMRGWARGEGHALSGLEDATLQLADGKPVLVIVDTLATLEVQSPDGKPYRSELDMDKDIVDGLKAWRNALPPGSCILAVHEESKAATGSGDGHAVRGSSRYLFSASQRLAFTYADSDDIGTRTLNLRGHDDADPLVAEIDIRIPKARRGGDAGAVIAIEHEYPTATVREVARYEERKLRRVKADKRDNKGTR